jgi:hypothetical protein
MQGSNGQYQSTRQPEANHGTSQDTKTIETIKKKAQRYCHHQASDAPTGFHDPNKLIGMWIALSPRQVIDINIKESARGDCIAAPQKDGQHIDPTRRNRPTATVDTSTLFQSLHWQR